MGCVSYNGRAPGRPPLDHPPMVVQVKLRLYPDLDQDLIEWFEELPDRYRAAYVKSALRNGAGSVTLADLPGEAEMIDALDALMEFEL